MYLDRTYKPRRRKNKLRLWPFVFVAIVAIILYEQQPSWLVPQQLQPTPIPTRTAASHLSDAEIMLSRSNYDGALAALQQVAQLEPQNPQPLIQQARLQLIFRNTDEARQLAERAVKLAPDSAEALATLARVLDWEAQYESATQYAFDALELDPNNAYTLAVLGEIYRDVGNIAIAETYLEDALAIAPNHPLVLRNWAYLEERQGNYTAAIEYYERAIAADPTRFDFYIDKARQYERGLLDTEKAVETYQKALEVYESAMTLDAYGFGLYNNSDLFQAVRILRRAIEADPTYGLAHIHLGMTYYALKNYEDAVPELEEGLRLVGEDARIEHLYSLGLAYVYKEPPECEKAIPWLLKALEIAPDAGPALQGIKICQ